MIDLITTIALLTIGILGAYNYILSRFPEAQGGLDKLSIYSGWIGLVAAGWGALLGVIFIIQFGYWLVMAVISLATIIVLLALGLIMGLGKGRDLAKEGEAQERLDKLEKWRYRLAPYQGQLGLAALILGVVSFVMIFF